MLSVRPRPSTTRRGVVAVLAATLALLGLQGAAGPLPGAAAASSPAGVPATVTADVLPTTQVDGVVWAQTTVGDTVYATGRFTSARPAGAPAGTGETPRGNLLAYDLTTGELVTSFAPSLNGEGLGITASPDGSRVYVVGNFTEATARGTTAKRNRVAAFDARTGALVTSFAPNLDYRARAVVAVGGTVYVGGQFGIANKTARTRLAAFSAADGSLLPWAPTADAEVFSLVAPGGARVVAAGRFTTLNGSAAYGTGALDPTSGATLPWAATQVVRNAGKDAAIYSLATDGTRVYGTGYTYGPGGNLEGSFAADATTGALQWVTGCRGDVYSVQPVGGVVYTAGHPHDCAAVGGWPQTEPWTYQRAMATTADARGANAGGTFAGRPAPRLLDWYPSLEAGTVTGQNQAAWSVTGNSRYVSLGGEFPRVDGVAQQGLVRMAVRSLAPRTAGPRYQADLAPTPTPTGAGRVRVAFRTTWDPDDRSLEYRLVRDGRTDAPVARTTVASTWWDRPTTTVVDTTATPGATHSYRVQAVDADGNVTTGPAVQVTLPPASATSAYAARVLADGASAYWPLGPATTTTTTGTAGTTSATDWAGQDDLVLDASVTRSDARAVSGDPGSASSFAGTSAAPAAGSRLQAAPAAFSVEAWVRTTSTRGGKLVGFGSSRTGTSTSYDRHLYLGDDGRVTFGVYPGTARTLTSPRSCADGAWHHVVATLDGGGTALYVDGEQVARDTTTTSAQSYDGVWRVGGDTLAGWPGRPSSASLAGDVDEVAVYPTALSADVVRDHHQRGTATLPNAAPTASFAATATGLTAALDASASADTDGSVVAHAWTFGDGTTGTGRTTTRTYPAAGTYPVTLTVTDDRGATASTTRAVTVTAPAPAPAPGPAVLAADGFGRTATAGWGSAETGGAWTATGGAANLEVAGGTGRLRASAPGSSPGAVLAGVSAPDADVRFSAALDSAPTGGGTYLTTLARRVDAATDYRSTARALPDGRVLLSVVRRSGGTETTLASTALAGAAPAPGARLQVRVQASGTGTTTVRAKVWADGAAEPAGWQVSATDTTPALQAPGGVGLSLYLSGSATTAPVVVAVDDLLVTRPQAG